MFNRLYEILKPKQDGEIEENYLSVDDLPVDDLPQDVDASNPEHKGE